MDDFADYELRGLDERRWPCGALIDTSWGEPDTDYCPECERGDCEYGDDDNGHQGP